MVRNSSRRWFLESGLAALGGLTLPELMRLQHLSAAENAGASKGKAGVRTARRSGARSDQDLPL